MSFNLRQGDALAIVGESGSGKTITALLALQPSPAACAQVAPVEKETAPGHR